MVLEAQQGAGTTMRRLRCDVASLYRIDNSYVHGARAKSQSKKGESQNGWEEEDDFWRSQPRSRYQSPRATQRKKAPRRNGGKKNCKQEDFPLPAPDPRWDPNSAGNASTAGEAPTQTKKQLHRLVRALKKQDEPIPTEVQQIMANTDLPVTLTKGLTGSSSENGRRTRRVSEDAEKARWNLQDA